LKVALITDGIWPFVVGGMQKHSYYLCKYLTRNKIFVQLYHSTRTGIKPDLTGEFSESELTYLEDFYIPYPGSGIFPGRYIRSSARYSRLIYAEFIKHSGVDIVYVKGLSGLAFFNAKRRGALLPPVFLNVHGYEYYQKAATIKDKIAQLMLRPVFKKVNKCSDYIFSYGPPISTIIRKHIPNSGDKIIEVPAAIEGAFISEQILQACPVRKFVFIGRYERRKGISELFYAVRKLAEKYVFEIHFIGPITRPNYMKNARYVFHGQVTDSNRIREILRNSEILVCPSYSEGMPNVILEGMASGCAIIATKVGAIPVEVDESNGWLIPPGSARALYNSLAVAITCDGHTLDRMRTSSVNKVKRHFTWDKIIVQIVEAFENAIGKYKIKP